MPIRNNFKILQTLYENNSTIIYRATRISDERSVIIKKLKHSHRNEHKIDQFRNEAKILAKLNTKSIIKILDIVANPSLYCHVLEDIGGESLYELILKHTFSLEESLFIALSSMQALQYLHQHRIIHADINPHNIIYNTTTRSLQLIDFGLSVKADDFHLEDKKTCNSSGNLFYIAPEQTGFTEDEIDCRSDTYSLGMSLYHLLRGFAPLYAKDPYELFHKQIVLTPQILTQEDKTIPKVISLIIEKMIHKNPNKRYQSDAAIIYDFKQCIQNLDTANNIASFKIATQDKPMISIGETLFGREKEMSLLQNTISTSDKQALRILISAEAGGGKTKLIEEALKTYTHSNKFSILTAKFDKYAGHLPYSAFRQLFASLSRTISTRDMAKSLQTMHQETAKILSSFFPELSPFFAQKSKKTDITDIAEFLYSKNQLSFAIKDFFENIATLTHPFIMFFDDIQWIDQVSSDLLQTAVLHSTNPHIHFIATIRDNEANTEFVPKNHYTLHIKLTNLSLQSITQMVKSTFSFTQSSSYKFAKILKDKTDGNPFYIKTFIEFLLHNQELYFENGEWKYLLKRIKVHNESQNIIELVRLKLNQLTPQEKSYLHYLALLGNSFDISLTLQIMQKYGYPHKIMQVLLKHGFIKLYAGVYQFSHDTLQQDALRSLHPDDTYKIHKNIGLFLEKLYHTNDYSNIIVIAYHLNRAYPIGKEPKRLFKLNILSIEEMLSTHAYLLASAKIEWIDKTFFHDALWQKEYKLSFKYSLLKAKALYMHSKFKEAREQTLFVISKCRSTQEKLLCFSLLKNIAVSSAKNFKETNIFGITLLDELGLNVPKTKATLKNSVEKLFNEINEHTLFHYPKELLTHTTLQNSKYQNISNLLVEYWEIAYYLVDVVRMQWCYLNLVQISFKYGNFSASAFGYVLYGSFLISQKEYKKAHLFGKIALDLNKKFNDSLMLPKIYNFVANFINPYTKKLSSNRDIYSKSLTQSKINGDIVFGTWANFLMHFSSFLSGTSLENLQRDIKEESVFLLNSGDEKMIDIFHVLTNAIDGYQNVDSKQEEHQFLTLWQQEKFYPALAWYGIIKAQKALLHNNITEGIQLLDKYVHSELNEVIMFPLIYLHIFRALLLLQKNEALPQADLEVFQSYYKGTPTTFQFYKLLLDAETNKNKENIWNVAKRYDKAIDRAKKEQNSFYLALANLLASRFWEKLHYKDMQMLYVNEAVVAFRQWGAYNLATKLKATLEMTLQETTFKLSSSSIDIHSSSRIKQSNFQALIKAYTAISQSKNSDALIKIFMKILLQTTVASSGVLILKDGGDFFIKAIMDYSTNSFKILDEKFYKQEYLPRSMIENIITTGESIVLKHPSKNGNFQYDDYFKNNTIASAVAIPIILKSSLQGVLYIQNNEVLTQLDTQSIQTLEMILTQVAIVFNNTTLIETLKTNDENLNKAQELLHVGSWSFDASNEEILWSAETYRIFDMKPFSKSITYALFLSFVHPEDLEEIRQAHDKALENGYIYNVEHRIITDKGTIKYVIQKAEIFIEDGIEKMSGTIQDITESYETKRERDMLSSVVGQSPNSIVITNTFGDIEYVNKKFITFTGYSKEEALGSNMSILNSKHQSSVFYEKLWNTILKDKKTWSGVIIDKLKDRRLVDLQTTIFPILDDKESPIKFAAIQEDITQKILQDKLFLIQTRQAQMGEMISMIAHQWRQPLAAISATTTGLKIRLKLNKYDLSTPEGQEAQRNNFLKQLNKIEDFVVNLSDTIDDFRNFYKPNKKPIMTTLKHVISKALNVMKSSLQNHKITLIQECHSTQEIELYDSEMIQVVLNILKNAQDAFVEKNTKDAKITIKSTHNTISICDNAGGIPQDIIEHIFEVYFSTKSEKNGTGLGLHMVKTIVERHHNGTIQVESKNGGTCFMITLKEASHKTD